MPGAELHLKCVGVPTMLNVYNCSLFVAKQFRQEAAPPDMISDFHINLFSVVANHDRG